MQHAVQRVLTNDESRDLDTTEVDMFRAAIIKISDVIREQYPGRLSVVYEFNDDSRTAWEDVERVMEKAAQS